MKNTRKTKSEEPEHDHNHEGEGEGEDGITLVQGQDTWGPETLTFFGRDSRVILCSGEISQHLANCIISQMLELSTESETEPIMVYINTDGGDVVAGLAIYDMMRIIPNPVITVVTGACHSAGLFILQGGDKRLALPHASFFYHEPVAFYSTNTEHATIAHAEYYKTLRIQIEEILQKRGKMIKRDWNKNFANKTAYFFTAKQALEHRLIDEIIVYTKEKPLKFKDT